MKKIGILTSGGDCAGLNAAIGAVTRAAAQKGYETIGIREGTKGLMGPDLSYEVLNPARFTADIMQKPSTFLGTTNKGDPFAYPMPDGSKKDRSDEIIENIHKLGIETLIGIGGDGSMEILHALAKKGGFNLVWIPKTIDNDVYHTELSIGFYSAVRTAVHFMHDLHATAQTHDLIMVTEVMGRDAGHLALHAGLAASADIILIPEIPYTFEHLIQKYEDIKKTGRNYAHIVVSEAVRDMQGQKVQKQHASGRVSYGGIGAYLKDKLGEATQAEVRVQSPGHTLRGCAPTANDIILAMRFGVRAVDLIVEGRFGRMVAIQNGDIVDVAAEDVAGRSHTVDVNGAMVHTAKSLGISFGD
ncbi:MAG: ATP-dependent 6-phosphofructokinase [Rhodospirillales bacterium]|nr:ATP-dependent 6-phosphofructokinase [Alphaproteobacteria bacterium]USO03483.1 MAG: ATP-dependent 6-phosphofructokinase [Rhodospirillales bacterium]